MQLSDSQVNSFESEGYIILENCLSETEVEVLTKELPQLAKKDDLRWVEEASRNVRTLYIPHTKSQVFNNLMRLPRLLKAVEQLLNSQVYIHQYTLHPKVALTGEGFEWHSDAWYSRKEDNIPESQLVVVQVFIDDATSDLCGPIVFLPGSHKEAISVDPYYKNYQRPQSDLVPNNRHSSEQWGFSMSIEQKYRLKKELLAEFVDKYGIVSLKGKAGTVAFLHANLLHASSNNITPWDRKTLRITYNSVNNLPLHPEKLRSEPIVWHDFTPLLPVADDILLQPEHSPV
ncbi:MAG: hypothetical protein F6J90_13690 [Moorea sp. SIOASIH]|uniref:phytanoyl-CoA dioxygenase family protein n=1 Tax=Moorena sp. SIOASIH TaxID=2607817 RepID=UPI0013B84247|nr:phytanoyl-CoA dioxygenase family protein [Moorena sp. SIOASIH]NEO37318.1 hypothetical protein [Moorena sp. SIOASIH]